VISDRSDRRRKKERYHIISTIANIDKKRRTSGKVIPQKGTPKGILFLEKTSTIDAAPVQSQKSPLAHRKSARKKPRNLVMEPASGSEKNGAGREDDFERSSITWERRRQAVPPCYARSISTAGDIRRQMRTYLAEGSEWDKLAYNESFWGQLVDN
jgi:hypothetical protein